MWKNVRWVSGAEIRTHNLLFMSLLFWPLNQGSRTCYFNLFIWPSWCFQDGEELEDLLAEINEELPSEEEDEDIDPTLTMVQKKVGNRVTINYFRLTHVIT